MRNCPYCAEKIQDVAIVCRFCGRDVEPLRGRSGQRIKRDSRRVGTARSLGQKSLAVAYGFWLFFLHYAYLRRWGSQVLFVVTLGGLGLWWLIDLLRMPGLVRQANGSSDSGQGGAQARPVVGAGLTETQSRPVPPPAGDPRVHATGPSLLKRELSELKTVKATAAIGFLVFVAGMCVLSEAGRGPVASSGVARPSPTSAIVTAAGSATGSPPQTATPASVATSGPTPTSPPVATPVPTAVPTPVPTPLPTATPRPVAYDVVGRGNFNIAGRTRTEIRVVVPGQPTTDQKIATLAAIARAEARQHVVIVTAFRTPAEERECPATVGQAELSTDGRGWDGRGNSSVVVGSDNGQIQGYAVLQVTERSCTPSATQRFSVPR